MLFTELLCSEMVMIIMNMKIDINLKENSVLDTPQNYLNKNSMLFKKFTLVLLPIWTKSYNSFEPIEYFLKIVMCSYLNPK